MITRLTIQGLAIIDSLSIEFSPGFNVITGETGAGKSILIRGLNFLMGAKAAPDTVRKGSPHANVVGEFTVPEGHPALDVLDKLGIPAEPTEEGYAILVRRNLSSKGRSQSWVNDVSVTSQPLRELGIRLVDVFGQHENQRLLEEAHHIRYIDQFLADRGHRVRVETLNRECLDAMNELRRMVSLFHDRARNQDYLNFRLQELTQFAPSVEDYEKIRTFCKSADQIVGIRDTLTRALRCLDGEDGEGGAGKIIWEAAKAMGTEDTLTELRTRANAVAAEVDELSFELGRRLSVLEFSDEDLESAQARLFGYQDLFRKHTVTEIGPLVQEADRLKKELEFLESAAVQLETTLLLLARKAGELQTAAKGLTAARSKAAAQTKRKVETELHELAMPGSVFEVRFSPMERAVEEIDLSPFPAPLESHWRSAKTTLEKVSDQGAERCQFLLASNPGEPILPLARIASGGELSRIMLAVKKALAADAETCVLVFDEIDSGISGRVADVVGRKMRELSESFQVICISHLPQVAVYADTHLLVKKAGKENRTQSSIVRLTKEESAREIARLLSGAEVSGHSIKNAKALIDKARAERPTKGAH